MNNIICEGNTHYLETVHMGTQVGTRYSIVHTFMK